MEQSVIIVAGGVGKRMQSIVPKQFLRIGHEVILMRTLRIFRDFDPTIKQILVLPEQEMATWERLCRAESFSIEHTVVKGGDARYHSVKNGLQHVGDAELVAVHDGVRPLVSTHTLSRVFAKAREKGNAIPVTEIPESIRHLEDGTSKAVPRDRYKLVQTPQVFESETLQQAYQQDHAPEFTDDASLVEKMGEPIWVVDGNVENIKITTQKDLELAGILLHFLEA
ncbi:MAG: 2-C-methyl-D-erythritol 4-phosphate cytidylyltransferase [Bacteroidales bacterium]|nr:2-C-methyl-D-erythritol 4-phosphate cytidylyltransferase [Bacteroidales bacterium]